MKRYKLIKTYPGSPELGTLVIKTLTGNYTTNISKDYRIWLSDIIENHPEFWEEIIEKEFEILSFKNADGAIDWYKSANNEYKHSSGELCYLEDLLSSKYWNIFSVKRLSDGEI